MRSAQKLPANSKMYAIKKLSYTNYLAPADFAEAALLKQWTQYLRLMDSDAACGAFLLDLITRSCDDDLKNVIVGWNVPPTRGRHLLRLLSEFSKVGLKTSDG